ncbi:unnamed protein product [Mytilus edulis]|uniref:UMOD/GP2/OIT3-like D8C domain-containing protein n=1 Tax=Mytilus edulis TaxID=6550 RepID=A0A8S3RSJ3_MYTED|nr:unnamed protein product [Mytilus edulis]
MSWYLITSDNGDMMPNFAPGFMHCGTVNPIWLNGNMPSFDDGDVTREACLQTKEDTCEQTIYIQIRNCSGYYLYLLQSSPENSSFCFGNGPVVCPDDMSSDTGYYPGCKYNFPTEIVLVHIEAELIEEHNFQIPIHGNQSYSSLLPVFRCSFGDISEGSYVYDVDWYINGVIVKHHLNVPFSNINSTVLRDTDWTSQFKMNMEVHALFTNCGFGWAGSSCHCGIAVRSRDSLFVLRTCQTISRTEKHLLPEPITKLLRCHDKDLVIEHNRNSYKITLPFGTEINFTISRRSKFISMIAIKPSICDINNARGLCGVPSTTKDQINPTMIAEQLFCVDNVQCNLTDITEFCSETLMTEEETMTSFSTACSTSQRKKRSVNYVDKIVQRTFSGDDDAIDIPCFTYDESAFSTEVTLVGDTTFLPDTIGTMLTFVMTEIRRNESLYLLNTTEGSQTLVEYVTSFLCPNNCSENGNCAMGKIVLFFYLFK